LPKYSRSSDGYVVKNDEIDTTKGDEDEVKKSGETDISVVLLFMLFGCAPSSALRSAMWCELPWFETTQPEGLSLGGWWALMEAVGVVVVLLIMYIDTYTLMPRTCYVWGSLVLAVVVALILAFTWSITISGYSTSLYFGMGAANFMAEVRYTIIIPWFVRYYNPRMLSAFSAGTSLMTIVFCVMTIIQQPGGVRTFSPTVFYVFAAIMFLVSSFAGAYIVRNGVQRKSGVKGIEPIEPWQSSMSLQFFPPRWWLALRSMLIMIWLTVVTSWLLPVLLPYASDNTTEENSTNRGENYLQWAMVLTYLARLIGSVLSHFATEYFWIDELTVVVTLIYPVFIFAAVGVFNWSSWGMRVILMLVITTVRAISGWCYPMIYRDIAKKYPEDCGQLSRFISLWVMTLTISVLIIEWLLIYNGTIRAHKG